MPLAPAFHSQCRHLRALFDTEDMQLWVSLRIGGSESDRAAAGTDRALHQIGAT